jgi:hypothetical protein
MGNATIIPVLTHESESISHLLEEVHERMKLPFTIQVKKEDLVVEAMLPETDLHNVAAHIAPGKFVITADIDEGGLQVCQVIDLPLDIAPDGVDAGQYGNIVRIIAALARPEDEPAEQRDSKV